MSELTKIKIELSLSVAHLEICGDILPEDDYLGHLVVLLMSCSQGNGMVKVKS